MHRESIFRNNAALRAVAKHFNLLGIEPTATLISGQPGGVRLETALFLAVGVLIGAGYGPAALARRLAGRRSPRI